ncbi:MAG TPA: AAA family ATPase, partial [Solirubrobacteraceae bacterium]
MTSGLLEPTYLVGRRRERVRLDELLAAVRQGESRSLLLRGEAGIGKTALLDDLVACAGDFTVARATGAEAELELPYASLQQLCAPLLDDHLAGLPDPQRDALRVVFGLSAGPAPDRLLVGLAVLGLLSAAAERHPLLCVIDDAQWVDRASALALAFVARRLLAEPLGLVFAAREPGEALCHVPRLEVQGLSAADARRLLDSTLGVPLDPPIRDRIIAETRGNPLALLELPRGLSPRELAGVFGLPEAGDLSERLEQHYARRVEALPEPARRLLLVAAAEPLGDPLLLHRACRRLGVDPAAVDATDDLLSVDERVSFRHPLARSAVYRSAGGEQRRATHLALAEVTDRALDPDRRAWHLATAAAGPDEAVARELERSAERARARGGFAAAAAFLRRAVALTSDPAIRAGRALAAAQASLGAGAFVVAHGLLATAEAGPLDALGRARLDRLRAGVAAQDAPGGDAPLLLLRAAKQLEALDAALARDTYLDAWAAAIFAGGLARAGGGLRDVSRAAAAAPQPPGGPRPHDVLLDGLALIFTAGHAAAAPVLQRAVAAFCGPAVSPEAMVRWGWLATRAANLVWDYDRGVAIGQRAVELCRRLGALEALNSAENCRGQAAAFGGDF